MSRLRSNKSGAALILAIFATVVLTILAVGLTRIVRAEVMASRAGYDRARARYLAKAGFTLACSLLMYDDQQNVDSFQDKWSLLSQEAPVELNDGTSATTIIDASSLINVNTANLDMLTTVTGDSGVAQAIMDWRSQYGPFHSIGEMIQVEGVTREWLAEKAKYLTVDSREHNVTANGEKRVNINTADAGALAGALNISQQQAQRIVSRRQAQPENKFASIGDLLKSGAVGKNQLKQIADRISLSDKEYISGRININTASRDVLLVLPGVTDEFIGSVITRQEQAREIALQSQSATQTLQGGANAQQGTGAFASLGEVLDLPGLTDEALASAIGLVCTKSSTYLIESDGGLDDRDLHVVLQGIVLRRAGDTPVIYGWREIPQPMYVGQEQQ